MHAGDATDFDPYYKWLGIPTSEQPPHHYRLLGIELFEEDPEVITAAADRQMGHVKAFATGPYAAHSQLLLNELSKARVSLLNPNLKVVYDQQLAKLRSERIKALAAAAEQLRPAKPKQSYPTHEVAVIRSHESVAVDAPRFTSAAPFKRKRRRRSSIPFTFITLLICVPVIAGLLWYAKTLAPEATPVAAASTQALAPTRLPAPQIIQPEVEEPTPELIRIPKPDNALVPQRQRLQNPPQNRAKQPLEGALPNQRRSPLGPPIFGQRTPDGGYFASLPKFISLSELSADQPVIGVLEPPVDRLRTMEIFIISPSYLERANRVIFLHRHRDTDEDVRWLVFDEPTATARAITATGDPGGATPIAMIRATESELSFAWLDEAGRERSSERLQNCVLRLMAEQDVHYIQLRLPLEEETPVVLGNWEEVYEYQLPMESIPNLPPASELMLRVSTGEGFPATRVVNGQIERLAAGEQLMLSFTSADYAGLGAYWEQKGKVVSIHLSPGFRLLSYPDDLFVLSRSEVENIEKRLARDKREAAKEYARRVRKRAVLNRNLDAANRINIQLPGGGTTVQLRNQKQAAVAAAQAQVNANEARITALGQLAPLIEQDETSRIPALRTLATDLEGRASVGFELFLPLGGEEIVLYRKGLPSADSNTVMNGL